MTDEPERAEDPFSAFVVVTTVKPDGRLIHYYEWPEDPPDAAPVEPREPGMPESGESRRV